MSNFKALDFLSTYFWIDVVCRMLKEDPELFQLYKDLVVSGIISTDEFWNSRKNVSFDSTWTLQQIYKLNPNKLMALQEINTYRSLQVNKFMYSKSKLVIMAV